MRILMYHEIVDGQPQEIHAVSKLRFAEQMTWLSQNDYRVIPLSDWVNSSREERRRYPSKTIVLTFDDGYLDNYTNALPVLQQYHFPATVFLIAGLLAENSDGESGQSSLDQRVSRLVAHYSTPILGWPEIREMAKSGIEFGSHSYTHPDFSEISLDSAREELRRSKELISDHLQRPVDLFCYPYGRLRKETKQEVISSGYRAACAVQPFYTGETGQDDYELQRISILADDTLPDFIQKVQSTFRRRLQWYRYTIRKALPGAQV